MYDRFRETCHDGDGVALDLIVANKHRAGLEAAPWRAAVPRQPVQEPQAFPIKPAKGPLLQAISATFALAEQRFAHSVTRWARHRRSTHL
jgi:hypothetical protein